MNTVHIHLQNLNKNGNTNIISFINCSSARSVLNVPINYIPPAYAKMSHERR